MSYIRRCQLSGYKSIKNVSCEFNKGLNIIIGNNGSGKTTFVEFMYKILTNDYTGLDIFNAEINIAEFDSYKRKDLRVARTIKESTGYYNEVIDRIEPHIESVSEPGNEANYTIEFIRFNINYETPILAIEYNPKFNVTNKRFILNDVIEPIPFVLRIWFLVFFKKAYLENIVESEFTGDYLFNSLNHFFEKFFWHVKKEIVIYSPVEDIRFSNSIRVAKIDSSTIEFRNIVFEYKINNEWFSWSALSDGTKRLIHIIFAIQGIDSDMLDSSAKDLIDLIGGFPITLIEEPEMGIHPHQLHLLMTYLKEKAEKQQIILTTHSPQVLDVLSEDELDRIFIAEIDYEDGTTIRKLTEKETEKARFYLRDEGMLSDYWRFSDLQESKQSK
jgi:AAA15 family ATPase/GTPase